MRTEPLPPMVLRSACRSAMLCALLPLSLVAWSAPATPATPAAQAPVAAAGLATAESLARIENDTLLLKAQERQMAVRLVLATQRNDLALRHAETRNLERPARAGDPTVVAVEGIGRDTHATLMLDNGSLFDAAPGDMLPNGMTVLSVRAGEVVVGRGRKERIRLSHAAPTAPAGAVPGPAPAASARAPWTLPPLTTMPPSAPASGALAVQGVPR